MKRGNYLALSATLSLLFGCGGTERTSNGGGSRSTCTPQCNGRVCGDDGCGGSCGTCNPGVCNAGQCQAQFSSIVSDGRMPAEIYQIAANAGRVVLAEHNCSDGCLSVVDVSDRGNPTRTGTFSTPFLDENALSALVVDASTVLMGTNYRLYRLDLSTLPTIASIASIDTNGEAQSLALYGNHLLVAEGNFGVAIYDTATLNPVGRFNPGGNPDMRSVVVDGDRAFSGGFFSGVLYGIALANPSSPGSAGEVSTGEYIWKIATHGGKLYVANGKNGLTIYDRSLTQIGSYLPANVGTYGIVSLTMLNENDVLLADAEFGLRWVDVTDPTSITERTSLPVSDGVFTITSDGPNLYAGDNQDSTDLLLSHLD